MVKRLAVVKNGIEKHAVREYVTAQITFG